MNRTATVVQLRMLLSNSEQLALMSTEISLQQTWKIVRVCWKEGAERAKSVFPAFPWQQRNKTWGGEWRGGRDTTPHDTAIQ